MPSEVSDPQGDPLHYAEREFYPKRKGRHDYAGRLTRAEAKKLIAEVRRLYGLPRVSLSFPNTPTVRYGACAKQTVDADGELVASVISFPGTNPITAHTLLHELAHVITDYVFGQNCDDHGREFVGVMSWLLEYFCVIPADALGLILRRHGVERRPVRYCSPEFLANFRLRRLT